MYVDSRFVGLNLAYLIELLNPCLWFDKPLYDLYFLDT